MRLSAWRAGVRQILVPETLRALSWPMLLAALLFAALIKVPGAPLESLLAAPNGNDPLAVMGLMLLLGWLW